MNNVIKSSGKKSVITLDITVSTEHVKEVLAKIFDTTCQLDKIDLVTSEVKEKT